MYSWAVFLHVIGVLGFMLAHGASASISFVLRRERNLERVRALLELSSSSVGVMYGSLLLLFAAGIVAGFMGQWWGRVWIWLSLGLLIVLLVVMYAIGSGFYGQVRKAVGLPWFDGRREQPAVAPLSSEEINALLTRSGSRPILLTAIGFGGIVVIAWLMMFKPF